MSEFFRQNYETLAFIGAALAVCLGAAWALIYYAAYAVRSQTFGKTVWCGNANANSVALTFDDGPAPETLEILALLRRENIKATFFLVGREVEKYPGIARKIAADGHEIGNHSYSHPIFLFCTPEKTRRELRRTQEIIEKIIGFAPHLARPPCGVRTPAYFAAAAELGLKTVQWSDAGCDWKKISAAQIAENVLARVQSDSIILLHDGDGAARKDDRRATVESLPLILEGLRTKNLHVALLGELRPETNNRKLNLKFSLPIL